MAKLNQTTFYYDDNLKKLMEDLINCEKGKLRFLNSKNAIISEAIREMHRKYIMNL